MTDSELLIQFARSRSQEAFAALVERYIRLVYSACRRQLGDAQLAEDATQMVFMLLSQKAGKLQRTELAGWLLTSARYTCANLKRQEQRRQLREEMVAMKEAQSIADANPELLEMLDEGLSRMSAVDRSAIVLRYLQDSPLKQVGEILGLSEDTARKRVDRAMEKLREFFRDRGVQTDSATLAVVLVNQSKTTIIDSLAHRIIHACALRSVSAGTIAASAALHPVAMIAASTVVGVATWGILHTPSKAAIPAPIPLVSSTTTPADTAAERRRITRDITYCQRNMRQIVIAMLDYAKKHNGHFPADLGSLIITEEISPQLFVCPSSNTRVPPELLNQGPEAQAAWVDQHSDYVYAGKGKTTGGSPDAVVLYEKDSDHDSLGMNITYADGHIDFNSPLSVAHQVIEKAPKN